MTIALWILGGLLGVYLLGALVMGIVLYVMAGSPWKHREMMPSFLLTVIGWPLCLPGILREIFFE